VYVRALLVYCTISNSFHCEGHSKIIPYTLHQTNPFHHSLMVTGIRLEKLQFVTTVLSGGDAGGVGGSYSPVVEETSSCEVLSSMAQGGGVGNRGIPKFKGATTAVGLELLSQHL
jgi:hypothetical protein